MTPSGRSKAGLAFQKCSPLGPTHPSGVRRNGFRSSVIKALAQVGKEAQGLQMRQSLVRSLPP